MRVLSLHPLPFITIYFFVITCTFKAWPTSAPGDSSGLGARKGSIDVTSDGLWPLSHTLRAASAPPAQTADPSTLGEIDHSDGR